MAVSSSLCSCQKVSHRRVTICRELLGHTHARLSYPRSSELPDSRHGSGDACYHDAFATLGKGMDSPYEIVGCIRLFFVR